MGRNYTPKMKSEVESDWWRWCGICSNWIARDAPWDCDHIIPWSKGGETTVDNAQMAHPGCNRSKKDRYQKRKNLVNIRVRGQEFYD